MKTFFSNTDISTLESQGKERNHFVSLIVNNDGEFSAKITAKLEITSPSTKISYRSFNNELFEMEEVNKENTIKVVYYDLDIIKEESFSYIDESIKKIKENKVKPTTNYNFYNNNYGYLNDKEDTLFGKDFNTNYSNNKIKPKEIKPIKKIAEDLLKDIFSLSLTNDKTFHLYYYMTHIEDTINKKFSCDKENKEKFFKEWVEYILSDILDKTLTQLNDDIIIKTSSGDLAEEMYDILDDSTVKNSYTIIVKDMLINIQEENDDLPTSTTINKYYQY